MAQGVGALLGFFGARAWGALAPGVVSAVAMSLALAYFSIAAFASFLLLRRHPLAIPFSLVVQVPQILIILDPGATFYFLAGLYARICISADAIALGFGGGGVAEATALYGPIPGRLGIDFNIAFSHGFQPRTGATRYCVNILAAVVSVWLMREWTRDERASVESRP
jgi:hypothetical protein